MRKQLFNYTKAYFLIIIITFITLLRLINNSYKVVDFSTQNFGVGDLGFYNKLKTSAIQYTEHIKVQIQTKVQSQMPSPMSEFLLGVTLGVNDLGSVPRFNDVMVNAGVIHVIVVSGFNITLVYNLIYSLLGTKYKFSYFVVAQILALIYSIFSGFQPPVIRAWVMGFLLSVTVLYGRKVNIHLVLYVSALLMILISPEILTSLSFQLSFLATASLVLFGNITSSANKFNNKIFNVLYTDFLVTLGAQVLVLPLIAYKFGRLSIVSFVANMFTLWIIPMLTVLGSLYIFLLYFGVFIHYLIRPILLVLMYIFIQINYSLVQVPFASVDINFPLSFLTLYYVSLLSIYIFFSVKKYV